MKMYSKGQTYKFQLTKGIFYNGEVIEEDDHLLKIHTIKGEEVVINKAEIRQSMAVVS